MSDAAQKILATQNVPALAPQGKALSLITEVEEYAAITANGAIAGW